MAEQKRHKKSRGRKKGTISQSHHTSVTVSSASRLDIQNHRLTGKHVSQRETPNKGGGITPRYLVFHYTAGRSAQSSINWLTNPEAKASAHLVVGRDGKITQLAPFNVKTWHAGRSHWDGLSGLNTYSIGIEMDNAGPLTQVGKKIKAWFGGEYPDNQVIRARHKLEQDPQWWHAYTDTQIGIAFELAKILVTGYGLKEIVGHEDIAPDRKRDPGPAFPLDHIRAAIEGRSEEKDEQFEVTASALNIRRGPGIEFATVPESPLKHGTKLFLLEKKDRWSKVEVEGESDLEGWVHNRFIKKV